MIRKYLSLLVLLAVFLLTACQTDTPLPRETQQVTSVPATVPTAVPATAPTTEPATEPTTEPTEAPTTAPATQPTEAPTEPVEENTLTQAELDKIKALFTQQFNEDRSIPAPVNYYNRLIWSDFDSPEQVDIRRVFYDQDIDEDWELTDAERTYLSQFEYVMLNLSVVRVSTAKMNAVLQQCLGITLDETDRVGMDTMAYFPDTDCYYSSKGDMGVGTLKLHRGRWLEDGRVEIEYRFAIWEKVMILQKTDTGYIVLSNRTVS